jgi:hypothetical protein
MARDLVRASTTTAQRVGRWGYRGDWLPASKILLGADDAGSGVAMHLSFGSTKLRSATDGLFPFALAFVR